MPERTEQHHPQVAQIVTGHFHETAGYDTWRARGTDDWLLIATVGGGGRFGHAAGETTTRAGDLVLLRPGTPHDYGVLAGGRWELLWTHFHPRPDWTPWLAWPAEALGLMRLRLGDGPARDKIFTRMAAMNALATGAASSSQRLRETFAMNALEEVLLWCDTQNPRAGGAGADARVRDAMDYLVRHLAEPVGLVDAARVCGLSPSRLAHLFRAHAGVTPQQFLEGQRLHRARQLLELTARPIGAVAAEVGYENPFYFTLRFKRVTGLSPRDYRKTHEGEGRSSADSEPTPAGKPGATAPDTK